MDKIVKDFIQIALLLVMISGLITGCEGLSSAPPASEYPADIIGRVTIAQKVVTGNVEAAPLPNNQVWWIVEISVKNKEYQKPVTFASDVTMPLPKGVTPSTLWVIIYNGNVWSGTQFASPLVTIQKGETGNIFRAFPAFDTADPNNAQICYQGQEPYSYGELITGDIVAVYDWDLKKVTKAQVSQKTVATVERMWVGIGWGGEFLFVELKPTDSALANKAYVVDLYEKGNLRASATVSWNQPEINVSSKKPVKFPVTKDEYDAYSWEDVSHIFTAKVHE